jgi:hypothetical protein
MSLAYLNLTQHEGKGLSPEYLERMALAWGPIRVVAAAAHERGSEVLLPLYTAIGTRFHVAGRRADPAVLTESLADVGLPASLADAAASDEFDAVIKASRQGAVRPCGHAGSEGRGGRPALRRRSARRGD